MGSSDTSLARRLTCSASLNLPRQLVGKLAALGGLVSGLAAQLGDTWVRAALESEYLRFAVLLLVSAVASGVEAAILAGSPRGTCHLRSTQTCYYARSRCAVRTRAVTSVAVRRVHWPANPRLPFQDRDAQAHASPHCPQL
jgi:hypothetical protein